MLALMAVRNPFTPTFGASPLVVGGRDRYIAEIREALETGPRHPAYTTLVTGERGMGKTVLLNEIEDMAHRYGWRVLDAIATDGRFIDELIEGGLELLEQLRPDDNSLTGAHAQLLGIGGGMERSASGRRDESVRNTSFRAILKELAAYFFDTGTGLLITVDELHSADIAETRRFGAAIQKVTRRAQQPIAFVGAGLPQLWTDLMSGDAATFLQRCRHLEVAELQTTVVKQVLVDTFRLGGSHIGGEALHVAASASGGHPYVVQLVGYEIWNAARDPARSITVASAEEGIAVARRVSADIFVVTIWEMLSQLDRTFLTAMLPDQSETAVSDIAQRTGMSPKQVSAYRSRLIKKNIVASTRYGYVTFAQLAMREWLRAKSSGGVRQVGKHRSPYTGG